MGKRCVVADCSNSHKDGVSLFKFPEDKKMRSIQVEISTATCDVGIQCHFLEGSILPLLLPLTTHNRDELTNDMSDSDNSIDNDISLHSESDLEQDSDVEYDSDDSTTYNSSFDGTEMSWDSDI
uniref:Uncharacterized protein n=1 Tax=Amphimedon queenslandica TaxID=400682 RepID=A0A1X7TUH2_AMPQE